MRDERRLEVLRAIVEGFVSTREPVGCETMKSISAFVVRFAAQDCPGAVELFDK